MKTQEEVRARLDDPKFREEDFLGFATEALAQFLDWDHIQGIIKPEATREEWERDILPLTEQAVLKEMSEYMEFAWGKVIDHRGISASRSIDKMRAWLWLLDDRDTLAKVDFVGYENYGAPKLNVICQRYGLPIPDDDWARNMIRGFKCRPDCVDGCGG
jgi:hypothetical protein